MMNENTSCSIQPSPGIQGREPYSVPTHPAPVDLRLSGNEGVTPPAELLEGLEDTDPESLRSYPSASDLEQRIAERHDIAPEHVLVSAGADDAMLAAFQAVLGPDRNIVVPGPTFVMIPRFARLTGAEVREIPWDGTSYPLKAVLEQADQDTAVIPVVSPNNPTGAVAGEQELTRLANERPDTLILLDHAYVEFADPQYNLMETAIRQPNVVVLRTFSKAWGLAGLRVGYAIGPKNIINWMRMAKSPYAVSDLSLQLAKRRLDIDPSDVETFIETIKSERDELSSLLSNLGADPQPSEANFVLAEFEDAEWVFDALSGQGISTRIFPSKDHLRNCLRITCPGDESGFTKLTRALRTIFEPEAILLDMDGVLADVSGSYRHVIQETAGYFGVRIKPEEISRAKMAGDANNDWELTKRLMEQQGTTIPLEEVKQRFETLYHGTDEIEGRYREEELLVDTSWLSELHDQFHVGIVTGRPRNDAERFLELRGIQSYIDEMICMEDTEQGKPHPDPVWACMDQLSVSRAWFLGDTPDDMTAGRKAGVLPVGVVPPGESEPAVREPLREAGASRVLETPEEMNRLLSLSRL